MEDRTNNIATRGWAKLTNGYWVAMANAAYIGWSGELT